MTWMLEQALAVEMIQAKTDQLGDAQTRGKGQVQHRPVPDAGLRARVRRIEQRLQSPRASNSR